jgi:hypothetical protein
MNITSIFYKHNDDELNSNLENNKIYDIMMELFESYCLQYKSYINNIDYLDVNKMILELYCSDTIKLFKLLNAKLEYEIEESKNADIFDSDDQEDLDELKIIILNINIIIDLIPSNDYIQEHCESEIIKKLKEKNDDLNNANKIIITFFTKLSNNAIELKKSISNMCDSLEKSTIKLNITLRVNTIANELKEIINTTTDAIGKQDLHKLKINIIWLMDNIKYLDDIIILNKYDINKNNTILENKIYNGEELTDKEKLELDEMNVIKIYKNLIYVINKIDSVLKV